MPNEKYIIRRVEKGSLIEYIQCSPMVEMLTFIEGLVKDSEQALSIMNSFRKDVKTKLVVEGVVFYFWIDPRSYVEGEQLFNMIVEGRLYLIINKTELKRQIEGFKNGDLVNEVMEGINKYKKDLELHIPSTDGVRTLVIKIIEYKKDYTM